MPQLVLDARYFSHRDIGVDMEVSISLLKGQKHSPNSLRNKLPVTAFDIVVVSTRANAINNI